MQLPCSFATLVSDSSLQTEVFLIYHKNMSPSLFSQKPQLLAKFLENAPFGGLSQFALLNSAQELGLNAGQLAILAPDGPISMIDYWFSLADEFMVKALEARQGLKIREKATLAVRSRLEYFGEHKEALRQAIAILALPTNAIRSIRIGARFADCAWRAFGDKSTDFNFYTKRTMLLGVDIATALFFLGDESEDHIETWAFLDRRIQNIMEIEKAKANFRKMSEKIPDPIPFLAQLRYGKRPMP